MWRLLRAPILIGIGFAIGFVLPYAVWLDSEVRSRFDDLSWEIPSRVYARPLQLAPGLALTPEILKLELDAARYIEDPAAKNPGTYARDGARFTIARRGFIYLDGREREKRIAVTLADGRVAKLVDADGGAVLDKVRLEPARIATLYGALEEDRRIVQLAEVPTLLVTGLQAVEDRDFKHHHGVDSIAILRAAWANLMAGHVVQGGSTLSQQLVKNLFLDRGQTLTRKFNEALLALIIECALRQAAHSRGVRQRSVPRPAGRAGRARLRGGERVLLRTRPARARRRRTSRCSSAWCRGRATTIRGAMPIARSGGATSCSRSFAIRGSSTMRRTRPQSSNRSARPRTRSCRAIDSLRSSISCAGRSVRIIRTRSSTARASRSIRRSRRRCRRSARTRSTRR